MVPRKINLLLALSASFMGVFFIDQVLLLIPRVDAIQDLLTFTGRIQIWVVAFTEMLPKYFLIGSGWQNFPGRAFGLQADMAHNTYIQLLINGGVFVFLFGIMLMRSTWHKLKNPYRIVLLVLMVNGLTEFGFFGFMNHSVLIFSMLLTLNQKSHYGG